ncbi:unnamed protein product [Camellia sinensis]
MPPTKHFRDMEQLSGGEKTVAALALLFSIHRPLKNRWSNEELMLATGTGGVTRLRHDLKLCSSYLCSAYLGVHVWDLLTEKLLQTRAFPLPITVIVVDPTEMKLFSGGIGY